MPAWNELAQGPADEQFEGQVVIERDTGECTLCFRLAEPEADESSVRFDANVDARGRSSATISRAVGV